MKKIFRKFNTNLIIQFLIIFYLLSYFPLKYLFSEFPATGGDTGSHFWPLYVMKEFGWSLGDFSIKFWNPGNFGGEPLFVHYFPFPFMIMAVLSYIFPIATAFNIVTILGCLTLPASIYYMFSKFKLKDPIPLVASILSLIFLLNDSYSIYGGNFASTLAGQFSHSISISLFFFSLGTLYLELGRKQFPICSTLLFSIIALTHAYTFILIPFAFLAFLFIHKSKKTFIHLFSSGILTLILASWFILPMIENHQWTSPFMYKMTSSELKKILFSNFHLFLAAVCLPFLVFFMKGLWRDKKLVYKNQFFVLFFLLFTLIGFYFLFPFIGLVDGRVLATLLPVFIIITAIPIGHVLSEYRIIDLYFSKVILLIVVCITTFYLNTTLVHWAKWNYESWHNKELYSDFMAINENLSGTLSMPRVFAESSDKSNKAGTPRAFEMLPYFANRSTGSGLYQESTITAPAFFYVQSMLSRTPSCPFFTTRTCSRLNLQKVIPYLDLFGIQDIVLMSEQAKKSAKKVDELKFVFSSGPWEIYSLKKNVQLVEVLNQPYKIIKNKDWKDFFYEWTVNYNINSTFLIFTSHEHGDKFLKNSLEARKVDKGNCNPKVQVSFKGFELNTNCPNTPHLIKFSYHPKFKTSDGSPYYLISPGFILSFPKTNKVSFEFGAKSNWSIYLIISLISYLFTIVFLFKRVLQRAK